MIQGVRRLAWIVGAILIHASVVQASAVEGVDMPSLDLLKWAFTQGGLVIVTLTILWSYRKDFRGVLAEQQTQIAVLTKLVQETTAAMQNFAASSDKLSDAVDRLHTRL